MTPLSASMSASVTLASSNRTPLLASSVLLELAALSSKSFKVHPDFQGTLARGGGPPMSSLSRTILERDQ